MAESVKLAAQKRDTSGTRAARRLRTQGRVPAVMYGHKEATVSLTVSAEEVEAVIRHGTRVVDLSTDGAVQKAQIAEVQWDHLGKEVLHVDFRRVSEHERIHLTIPIDVRGTAPGVTAGGLLEQPLHTLSIECPADSVPESIRVNVNELQLDAAIHVRDLHLPPGVTALDDADAIVVQVTAPQAEPEPTAAPAGTAEPEVIGRQKAEEETEEK